MPSRKCKCSICRSQYEHEHTVTVTLTYFVCAQILKLATSPPQYSLIEDQMKHSERVLEVLYAFPPKVPKRQRGRRPHTSSTGVRHGRHQGNRVPVCWQVACCCFVVVACCLLVVWESDRLYCTVLVTTGTAYWDCNNKQTCARSAQINRRPPVGLYPEG
jgi:hypothetical protein